MAEALPARHQVLARAGLTPRYLSRSEAAAYVGVSEDTFDQEVSAGLWPKPRRRGLKKIRVTWDRHLLDAFADRDSGLAQLSDARPEPALTDRPSGGPLPPGPAAAAAAEAAALRGVTNASANHRSKHRQPQAA